MSGDDERERPKRSWAEIDRLRDRPRARRDERAPRGPAAKARAQAAAKQYLAELDRTLFTKGAAGGAAGARLAAAVRAAQGSAGLADACRAYLAAIGPPAEPALLSAFLDTGERELQRSALAALAEGIAARGLTLTAGLRAQIRTLAEGPDDELADAAEAVLR
ncbi:MAG: hypothetical protein OZ948_16315 [Deltaproteobacteria bacterium]|nr:hypothetical protein [Deltaproteobacteria bacterium]